MPTTPPLQFEHLKGFEIPTKHKEAIRQLHWFAKVPVCQLEVRYKLGESTIRRILDYDVPERFRANRVGIQKLTDQRVDEIIEYCLENWEHRIIKYKEIKEAFHLTYTTSTL
jgi:hypothetical protein